MNRPHLLIRADANSDIGYGHVMRCLALGQRWQRFYGRVTFVCEKHLPPKIEQRLRREAFEVEFLSAAAGTSADANELINLAKKTAASAIVIDGYQFDSHYQRDLHNHSFVTLVLDDYIHLQAYHADLILNQNPQIVSSQYAEKCGSAELLLGPTFALLRQEMLSAFNEDSGDDLLQKQIHGLRMLITLGGTDPGDVTQTVLRAIEKMAPRFQLQVKLLSAVPNLKLPAADVTLIPFSNNMAELYEWANVAICAGGSTNWEMCYFGIPRLAIVLADNQRSIVDYLHRMDCCLHGGWFQQLRLDAIIEQLNPLLIDSAKRHAMRQANRQLIDGQGAEQVTSRIMEKIRQSRVTRTSKPD